MKKKILIVEDNKDIREFVGSYLGLFFEVVLAENGQLGLWELNQHKFDLVITDYNMPVMNGLDFVLKAKEQLPNLPIIMISTDVLLPDVLMGNNLIEKLVEKPFTTIALKKVVNDVLKTC